MEENIQSVTRHYTNPGRQRNKRRVREASIQEGRKKCSVNRLTRFKCLVSDSSAAGTQHQAPGDASPRHQRKDQDGTNKMTSIGSQFCGTGSGDQTIQQPPTTQDYHIILQIKIACSKAAHVRALDYDPVLPGERDRPGV